MFRTKIYHKIKTTFFLLFLCSMIRVHSQCSFLLNKYKKKTKTFEIRTQDIIYWHAVQFLLVLTIWTKTCSFFRTIATTINCCLNEYKIRIIVFDNSYPQARERFNKKNTWPICVKIKSLFWPSMSAILPSTNLVQYNRITIFVYYYYFSLKTVRIFTDGS